MNNRSKRSNRDSELYRAILSLKDADECYNFFLDLCTVSELKAMEQRNHQPREPKPEIRRGRLSDDF